MDFTELQKRYEDCRKECKEHFEKAQKKELDNLFLRLKVNDFFMEHNNYDFFVQLLKKMVSHKLLVVAQNIQWPIQLIC